eukprot:COSAG03_NODE_1063_length_4926_cov_40.714108_3_plen_215_part_00
MMQPIFAVSSCPGRRPSLPDRSARLGRDRQRQTETDRDRQRQTETDRERDRQRMDAVKMPQSPPCHAPGFRLTCNHSVLSTAPPTQTPLFAALHYQRGSTAASALRCQHTPPLLHQRPNTLARVCNFMCPLFACLLFFGIVAAMFRVVTQTLVQHFPTLWIDHTVVVGQSRLRCSACVGEHCDPHCPKVSERYRRERSPLQTRESIELEYSTPF